MNILINIMNSTNELISILINDRERIINKLIQDYSYDYLLKIFTEINLEKDKHIKIIPDDKRLYRILTGMFEGSKYNNSSIDWIPSEELVDGIISLAKYFNIKHIEEIYTGMGILSALLIFKNKEITITTADTFQNINTCNKLGLVSVAKRAVDDYQYYKQLNEQIPQMIISTYYPSNDFSMDKNFIEEISNLINSDNHKIIIIILPFTFTALNDYFYFIAVNSQYSFYTYHIKALDKHFYIYDLLKKYYKSPMVAHLLIKNDPFIEHEQITSIFGNAIIPSIEIDKKCNLAKILQYFYDKFPPKLIKYIYKSYDFTKPFVSHNKINEIMKYYNKLKDAKHIPKYIFEIDEFLFWAKCVELNLFFIFENRYQFYDFYTQAISIKFSETRRNIGNFPQWISDLKTMYKYIYLETIKVPSNWKKNKHFFNKIFNDINDKNKKLIYDK